MVFMSTDISDALLLTKSNPNVIQFNVGPDIQHMTHPDMCHNMAKIEKV